MSQDGDAEKLRRTYSDADRRSWEIRVNGELLGGLPFSDGRYVRTFHQDDPETILWEGWVYPTGERGPTGIALYHVPLEDVQLGRTWSVRWGTLNEKGAPSV